MSREKAINSADELWSLFQNFIKFTEDNPRREHDYVGKDAIEVYRKKSRPITWIGFEGWLAKQEIVSHLAHYEQNTGNSYSDFLPIIRAIKKICSADVIEGALSGVYNQNIAARLEGLKDQQDINLNDSRKATSDLFPLKEEEEPNL